MKHLPSIILRSTRKIIWTNLLICLFLWYSSQLKSAPPLLNTRVSSCVLHRTHYCTDVHPSMRSDCLCPRTHWFYTLWHSHWGPHCLPHPLQYSYCHWHALITAAHICIFTNQLPRDTLNLFRAPECLFDVLLFFCNLKSQVELVLTKQ